MVASNMENKNHMAEELVKLFKHVDYDETVCSLKEQYAVPIQDFDKMESAKWFSLDTSKCFTGKQKLTRKPVGFMQSCFLCWFPCGYLKKHMVSIWTPHGIHVETLWCPVETT